MGELAMGLVGLLAGLALVAALGLFLISVLLFGSPTPRASRWRPLAAVALMVACGLGLWCAFGSAPTWVSIVLLGCLLIAGGAVLVDRHLHVRKAQRLMSLLPQDYPEEITASHK